eukprot:jgi/Tetstr1/431938/TSEL_021426.t1
MTVLGTPLSASCGDGGAAAAAARGGSAPSAPRPPSAEGPQLSGSRGSDFGTPVNPDLLRQYQVANLQLQLQLQQLGIALGAETAEVKKLRATIVKLRTQTMRVKCDELRSLREQVNDWKKDHARLKQELAAEQRRAFVARSRATTAEEKLRLAFEKAEVEREKHDQRVREMEEQAAVLSRVYDRLRGCNNLTEEAADRSFDRDAARPTARSGDATSVRLPQVDGRKLNAKTTVASLINKEATYLGEFIKARATQFQEAVARLFGRGPEEVDPSTVDRAGQPGDEDEPATASDQGVDFNQLLKEGFFDFKPFAARVVNRYVQKMRIRFASGEVLSRDAYRFICGQFKDAIEKHWSQVAVDMHARNRFSFQEWQQQVHLTFRGWADDGQLVRMIFPCGVTFPRLPTVNQLRTMLDKIYAQVEIDAPLGPAASASATAMLKLRIRQLLKEGKVVTKEDGKTLVVQFLADSARHVQRSAKNGTSCTLKVLWDLPEGMTAAEALQSRDANINSVDGLSLWAFFFGDDKLQDIQNLLPVVATTLNDINQNGIEVDGVHYNVDLLVGGDLKFLNSILGLNGCSSTFPCIYCEVNKNNLHLFASQRYRTFTNDLGEEETEDLMHDRDSSRMRDNAHARPLEEGEEYHCHCCHDDIKHGHAEPDRGKSDKNGGTLTPEARAQTNMKHKGTMYEPLIQLAILSYTFDVMHCKLRVIPKLWRWTVPGQMEGESFVKSKNGKKTTTTERKIHDSWAGAVCSGLMDNHVKILQRVHGITSETPESEYSPEYKSLESRTEHGRQLRVAAERFLATVLEQQHPKDVTVYMHIMACHVEDLVIRHGSLMKLCTRQIFRRVVVMQWLSLQGRPITIGRKQKASTRGAQRRTAAQQEQHDSMMAAVREAYFLRCPAWSDPVAAPAGAAQQHDSSPEELEAACWRDAGEDEAEAEELSDEDEEGELVVEHQANSGLDDLLSQSGSVAEQPDLRRCSCCC